MAEPHVITALVKKRGELAGQIDHAQCVVRQLVIDLDNLDSAIHLFDPSIELQEIKARPVPPRHQAFRGKVSRIVLAALRNASKPITAQDIAQHVMAERGLNSADAKLLRLIGKRVGACLRHHRSKGVLRSAKGEGQRLVWEMVEMKRKYDISGLGITRQTC